MARRLISLVLLLAACAEAGPPTLDVESVHEVVPALVWPDDPALVADVSCPDLLAEFIAQSVACTATLDGEPITADVVVDEVGFVAAVVRQTLFRVADAEAQLAGRLADDLGISPPTVTCTRSVVLARTGTEIPCTASNDGSPIDFTVRLLDGDGNWSVEIAP
ncbi:MAG: DUF4333 domain-containing protein [Acidimicrobiales bacterium]|nr:DUF4333 domain-containing protein [Acidimicrobiales bacterium]